MMFNYYLSVLLLGISVQTVSSDAASIKGKITARGVRSPENVVVYLEKVEGEFKPPEKNPRMDQKNLIFVPHVLPVLVGTTVDFPNSDDVRHNVFSPRKENKFNLGTYSSGVVRSVTFSKPGIAPLLCNVHAEMSAFIVVLENPYYAVSNREGTFEIKGVPPGTYTIKTWHEKLKDFEQEITVPEEGDVTLELKLTR